MGNVSYKNKSFFVEIFKKDIKYFLKMYIIQLCQVFISISMPIIMMKIIDLLIIKGSLHYILLMNLLYFFMSFLICIFRYTYMLINYKWRIHFEYTIQTKIIFNCINNDENKKYATGEVDTMIKKDTIQLEDFILNLFIEIPGNILRFIFLSITLLCLNWRIALCILVINICLTFWQSNSNKEIEKNAVKIRDNYSLLYDVTTEISSKTSTLMEIGATYYALNKFKKVFSNTMGFVYKGLKMNMTISQKISFSGYLVQIIVLIYGSIMVYRDFITVGAIVSFLQYSGQLTNPIQVLMKLPNDIANIREIVKRIVNTTKEYSSISCISNKDIVLDLKSIKYIKAVDLSFKYKKNKRIFNDVNFLFEKNNLNVIYGSSGEGKTTLLKILMGSLTNYTGEIYIDDKKLNLMSKKERMRYFSYLPQSDIIFKDTIRENICLGKNITQRRLEDICISCEIHDEIIQMENSYDTLLCPENINISGGQIKRIMLARMLVEEKPILLLDEPTSSLDKESARKIIKALTQMSADKLIIVITHDPEFVQQSNGTYQVKNKKITKTTA